MNFFDTKPAYSFYKRDIILGLPLLLHDVSRDLDPSLDEKPAQTGLEDCIPHRINYLRVYEHCFLPVQFVCLHGAGERPDQVLFLKEMIAKYLLNFLPICCIHI
jgi:hypothetical protein